jgi:diguanylate cyclase (GGDEF)-like protein/PAS domain S-box-containing protein
VHRLLMPDGREKWVHQRGSHSFGSNGRPKRSVGTVQDITERHYSEQQLRVAATAFESQEGMVVTDRNNVILRVNRSFTNITGYTPEEAVGNTPRLLASGQHGADFYSALWQQLDQTGSWQGEIWNRRKSGEIYPEWLTITTVKDDSGVVTNYVGTMTDITRRKLAEDEIKSLAFFDPLTRLPNRRLLIDRLQQAFATSGRSGRWGALLFLDLDHFKNLNDTLGHDIGDLLLQQVAQRLTECVREGDTVARLGGDEFVVMLEGLSQDEAEAATQTGTLGQKIVASLNQPFHLGKHVHHSTPSIGATQFNAHNCTVDELLEQSDLAMYKAKTSGRNALCFFDPQMQAVVTARASMEAKIRKAVSENQFVLYYQPQILARFNVVGAEGLVRWKDPDRGIVPPSEFISLAEESGLILPIGLWVLRAACEQLAIWATIPRSRHLTISVNVSARQLYQQDFVHEVLAVIKSAGANPNLLKLELTESLLVSNVEETIEKKLLLKGHGVRFALDDFGTGFSSLAYLKRLPLDQLKIDQSFVRDILTDPNDAAIAKTVIALAGSLGLSVIAEGVETESQRGLLEAQGCDSYQGYLFGRPMPIAEFEVLLGQRSLQKDN